MSETNDKLIDIAKFKDLYNFIDIRKLRDRFIRGWRRYISRDRQIHSKNVIFID